MKYQKIENLREDSDLTQRQMGEILHLSARSYCHYERGTRDMPVEILARLADHYNTSIDYLLGRTNNREKYPEPQSDEKP